MKRYLTLLTTIFVLLLFGAYVVWASVAIPPKTDLGQFTDSQLTGGTTDSDFQDTEGGISEGERTTDEHHIHLSQRWEEEGHELQPSGEHDIALSWQWYRDDHNFHVSKRWAEEEHHYAWSLEGHETALSDKWLDEHDKKLSQKWSFDGHWFVWTIEKHDTALSWKWNRDRHRYGQSKLELNKAAELPELIQSLQLPKGTEQSLLAKANSALALLERGNFGTAANQLQAFINEVNAQDGKKISEQDAATLVEFTQRIMDVLGDEKGNTWGDKDVHNKFWSLEGHSTPTTRQWESLGHLFEWTIAGHNPVISEDWLGEGHFFIDSAKTDHYEFLSEGWDATGHNYFWSPVGHRTSVTVAWNKKGHRLEWTDALHETALSRQWHDADHSLEWSARGHDTASSWDWVWTGHPFQWSMAFEDLKHEVDLSREWQDRGHYFIWTLKGHDTALSIEQEGDPFDFDEGTTP